MLSLQPNYNEHLSNGELCSTNKECEIKTCQVNLAYQNLTTVPKKILQKYSGTSRVTELDLSYNKITDLKFLLDLPYIETLILDHNNIHQQIKYPECPSLTTLWVNHNNIDNLGYFITTISQSFPNLRYLSMMNNVAAPSYFNGGSFIQYKDYRHFVISQLNNLIQLDDEVVTKEERREAERIYFAYQPQRIKVTQKKPSKKR